MRTFGVLRFVLFGAVGFGIGGTLVLGLLMGAVLGASLGVAFGTIVALAVAGAVGFGIGLPAGEFLWSSFLFPRGVGNEDASIIIAGVIGGASLGAVLGYLETHKLTSEQRLRVRST